MKMDNLPRSLEDFIRLKSAGEPQFTHCEYCSLPFGQHNVRSMMGWRETQISGLCEDCFDKVTQEHEDEDLPPDNDSGCSYCG